MTGRLARVTLDGVEVARLTKLVADELATFTVSAAAPTGLQGLFDRIRRDGFLTRQPPDEPPRYKPEAVSDGNIQRLIEEVDRLWPAGLGLVVSVEDIG